MAGLELKPLLAGVAMLLTIAAFLPYFRGILAGRLKPHVFTWLIWAIVTVVVFIAQYQAHGGAGAWAIGFSAALTVGVLVIATLKRADTAIHRIDWLFLLAALAGLALWQLTDDPVWTVAVLTGVDLLGFGPTVRKAYHQPHSESIQFFGLFMVRNLLVVLALATYSWTTVLFPAAIAIGCALLMGLIAVRRVQVGRSV